MTEQQRHSIDPQDLRAPTVDSHGKRRWIYPERRSGRRARNRRALALLLIAVYLIVPFIKVQGLPLLRFDLASSIVYVLGQAFRFADGFYLVFVLLAAALLLAWATSLWGRIWCGYACPQTVFVEWLIRPVEEFFEGPAIKRRKNDQRPLDVGLLLRKSGKHAVFGLIIFLISNAFLAYFVDPKTLVSWVQRSPWEHPQAFLFMGAVFCALYFDLVWFREQFCSFLCPYARFQSVMISAATPTVAYDYKRGEPRGKRGVRGDCIDCALCVRVCPTGIDIRQGLQLECIQCMRCADACDSIMTGLKRPLGLIRAASEMELQGQVKGRKMRLRPLLYLTLLLVNLGIVFYLVARRDLLKTTILRQASSTFVEISPERTANYFSVRVVNQGHTRERFEMSAPEGVDLICSLCGRDIEPNQEIRGNLVVFFNPQKVSGHVTLLMKGSEKSIDLPLLSARVPR